MPTQEDVQRAMMGDKLEKEPIEPTEKVDLADVDKPEKEPVVEEQSEVNITDAGKTTYMGNEFTIGIDEAGEYVIYGDIPEGADVDKVQADLIKEYEDFKDKAKAVEVTSENEVDKYDKLLSEIETLKALVDKKDNKDALTEFLGDEDDTLIERFEENPKEFLKGFADIIKDELTKTMALAKDNKQSGSGVKDTFITKITSEGINAREYVDWVNEYFPHLKGTEKVYTESIYNIYKNSNPQKSVTKRKIKVIPTNQTAGIKKSKFSNSDYRKELEAKKAQFDKLLRGE